jgi:hypothetical protein
MTIDYRSFEKNKQDRTRGVHWWREDKGKRHECITAAVRFLRSQQTARTQTNLRCARLYGNLDHEGFGLRSYNRTLTGPNSTRISLNVIAACCDTLTAKIAKSLPRPSFQTEGANWLQQMAARKLDSFMKGWFYEAKMNEHGPDAFLRGMVFDIAGLKLFVDQQTKKVNVEAFFPPELLWDEADAFYGNPRQLFQVRVVAREVLQEFFLKSIEDKDERAAVLNAIERSRMPESEQYQQQAFGDMVQVYEGWHLPSGPEAKDGLHVIAIDGADLVSEEWERDYFPFAFLRFSKRMAGFGGQSLAERLIGHQLELNYNVRSICEQIRRRGKGRIYVPRGSKVILAHLTNGIADIVEYSGMTPPTVDSANVVAPEQINQLQFMWRQAFEEAGISQLSASMKNPFGADASGAVIREYNDVESERFVMVGKGYERMFLDAGRIAIDLVRDLAEGGDYKVAYPNRRKMERINWKDINLERDDYVMQMFPVSSLPQTPAARMARVNELKAEGYIDQTEARLMLDLPDLEASDNLALAAIDDVDQTIYAILEGESPPDPEDLAIDDLQSPDLIVSRGTAAYLRAKVNKAPDDRLEILREWVTTAAEILAPPPGAQPPAPGPGGPAAMPPGAPPPGGAPPMGPPTLQ